MKFIGLADPLRWCGRRTPHGVRGLKFRRLVAFAVPVVGRTPHGVRGLKFISFRNGGNKTQVAPLTGCVD